MDILRTPFAFLLHRVRREETVVAEARLIREHRSGAGRSDEILDGQPTSTNRSLAPQQVERLLDRPDLLHAVGADDMVAAHRAMANGA